MGNKRPRGVTKRRVICPQCGERVTERTYPSGARWRSCLCEFMVATIEPKYPNGAALLMVIGPRKELQEFLNDFPEEVKLQMR